MSERTTHNIIASTNAGMNALALEVPAAVHDDIMARWREAADRLAELDAEVNHWIAMSNADHAKIDALLPPCPTCRGKRKIRHKPELNIEHFDVACPDCVDGKVSIEQLVATYRVVQEFLAYSEKARSDPDTLRHLLRNVTP